MTLQEYLTLPAEHTIGPDDGRELLADKRQISSSIAMAPLFVTDPGWFESTDDLALCLLSCVTHAPVSSLA